MNKTAFITGSTSGIGKATAFLFAENGIDLVLCGRRKDRLKEMQVALSKKVNIHTLSFDIRDKYAVQDKINSLPENFNKIDILINNAGNAHGLDSIENGTIEDWDAMIDING